VPSTEFQRCVISKLPSRAGSDSEPECDHGGVEVGEPGLPRDPREEERRWVRRRGQARLSVLDRWPRWVAVKPAKEWRRPAQEAEDFAALASYRASVVFYAVVSDEIHQVIGFFRIA
jgi:hypothetical protein